MKKLTLLLIFTILISRTSYSQKNDNSGLILAGAGLLAAGVSAAVIVEQYKEYIELNATEYLLSKYQDNTRISVSILDFEGVKLNDFSNTSCVSFRVTMRNTGENVDKKYVLLMFTNKGWINDFGVNLSLVNYYLFDKIEWNKMISTYINLAIENPRLKIINFTTVPALTSINSSYYKENDSNYVKITKNNNSSEFYLIKYKPIEKLELSNTGIQVPDVSWQLKTDFIELNGDSYLIQDYSNDFKIIYNEKTLGVFLKSTKSLSQLKRSTLNKIHEFVNN
jgi:hypothetical protein